MSALYRLLLRAKGFCNRSSSVAAHGLLGSKCLFAISAVSLFASKTIRIYTHFHALSASIVFCGPSFFLQDVFILALQFKLLGCSASRCTSYFHRVARFSALSLPFLLLLLANISISFFFASGSELQWRNVSVIADPSWWTMLPSGLAAFTVTLVCLVSAAVALQNILYAMAAASATVLRLFLSTVISRISCGRKSAKYASGLDRFNELDITGPQYFHDLDGYDACDEPTKQPPRKRTTISERIMHCTILALMAIIFLSAVFRPSSPSLTLMSWALPLLPMVELTRSAKGKLALMSGGLGAIHDWENKTAITTPRPFSWLPEGTALLGFEDWYLEGSSHYDSAEDPLKVSNLHEHPLKFLRETIKNVEIRHVLLVFIESQRKDVFPVKRDGFIWEKLKMSFPRAAMPLEAEKRLATLTPTAKFITGDYENEMDYPLQLRRGGINAKNAHTSSTYTLKSLTGSLCGLSPVIADFNEEQNHHIYQPCLPHILNALNAVDGQSTSNKSGGFESFPWKSIHMQSATTSLDGQKPLMSALGFTGENIIDREYLEQDTAKHGKVTEPEVNYFSLPEVVLEKYFHDAFTSAEENNERVFLSHLTSTTHHMFGIPESEQYVSLSGKSHLDELSRYLNAVAYSDRWLAKILKLLEHTGVANKTLAVFVGDHGLPILEGSVSTYGNANSAGSHVPLVFSHPSLPPIAINEVVNTAQILPTILDMLVETGSVTVGAELALSDLRANCEGQSLLRPIQTMNPFTGHGNWQFTVVNPGGSMLSARDARQPNLHLVVPLADGVEWRFSDKAVDPHELEPVLAFDFSTLKQRVERHSGTENSNWVEEATAISVWWSEENKRRWRYGVYANATV